MVTSSTQHCDDRHENHVESVFPIERATEMGKSRGKGAASKDGLIEVDPALVRSLLNVCIGSFDLSSNGKVHALENSSSV